MSPEEDRAGFESSASSIRRVKLSANPAGREQKKRRLILARGLLPVWSRCPRLAASYTGREEIGEGVRDGLD
ncbi:hypothetical protein GWI33_017821 [Rhynchophorus ferrugineus]|uniref:Uncharacterized protein n=1 Tax=Rhynchophorus ferrugineus TaxID=354439 RepID=A0A834HXP9_RHYFE|nr:hypothetical protein GWI33_017821 [Rhynchophorus ferrugineus]